VIYELRDGEPLRLALRKFRQQVAREGILHDAALHREFVKPSMRKRLKIRLAASRRRKQERKDRQYRAAHWWHE